MDCCSDKWISKLEIIFDYKSQQFQNSSKVIRYLLTHLPFVSLSSAINLNFHFKQLLKTLSAIEFWYWACNAGKGYKVCKLITLTFILKIHRSNKQQLFSITCNMYAERPDSMLGSSFNLDVHSRSQESNRLKNN